MKINNFQGDLTNIALLFLVSCVCFVVHPQPVLLFSKLNKVFFGYFDPENDFFQMIQINNCRGDLTDVSAKKEALSMIDMIVFV